MQGAKQLKKCQTISRKPPKNTDTHKHTCHESHTHTHTPTVIANVIKLCSASISALACSILLRARLVDCQSGEEEEQCALAVTRIPFFSLFLSPLGRLANIIIFIIMTVVVTIKTITKTKVVSLHGN